MNNGLPGTVLIANGLSHYQCGHQSISNALDT